MVHEMTESAHYEIRIRGHLGETLLTAFPTLHAEANAGQTVLTGALPDEAALHGVLAQIEALGRLDKLMALGNSAQIFVCDGHRVSQRIEQDGIRGLEADSGQRQKPAPERGG